MPQYPYDEEEERIRRYGGRPVVDDFSGPIEPDPWLTPPPQPSRLSWQSEVERERQRWLPQVDPEEERIRRYGGVDVAPEEPGSLFGRLVTDPAITFARGLHDVPAAALGLADIVTGGAAGKAVEDYTPWNPQGVDAYLQSLYTPEQKQAFENVRKAEGFLGTLGEVVRNPSIIPHGIIETIPGMYAGGALGRAAAMGTKAYGSAAAAARAASAAGAIGEGLYGAGSAAEQMRQQDPSRTLGARGSLAALASGAGTTAFGLAGGRAAKALGIEDIDQAIAESLGKGSLKEAAELALKEGAEKQISTARAIVYGFVQEGFLEELPQSIHEQVVSNWQAGRDLMDGVPQSAVLGAVIGGVMGGGHAGVSNYGKPPMPPKTKTAEEEAAEDEGLPPERPPDEDEEAPQGPPREQRLLGAGPPERLMLPPGPTEGQRLLGPAQLGLQTIPPESRAPGAPPIGRAPRGTLQDGVTPEMAQQLGRLGYMADQVSEISYDEAQSIIEKQQRATEAAATERERVAQAEEERKFLAQLQDMEDEAEVTSYDEEHGQELRVAMAKREAAQKALDDHVEAERQRKAEADRARRAEQQAEAEGRLSVEQQQEAERRFMEELEAMEAQEKREEELRQQVAKAEAEEREISDFLKGQYRTAQTAKQRQREEDYLQRLTPEQRDEYYRQKAEAATAAQRGEEPPEGEGGVPPTAPPSVPPPAVPPAGAAPAAAAPPTAAPAAAAPPTTRPAFTIKEEPLSRESVATEGGMVQRLTQAAQAIDPKVSANTIKKTYEDRLTNARALLSSAKDSDDDSFVNLAKAIAAAGGWNEMDRVVGNRYWKPRPTGEMQAVKDMAASQGYGNSGSFGSMAGIPKVFRKDGLPTDMLLLSLTQEEGRFPQLVDMDVSEFREYVMKQMAKSPSSKLHGRITLGNLRIDPGQQWWVPAHLRSVSRITQGMRRDRAAAEATSFDPEALETPQGPAGESRFVLKDLKRGKYEEQIEGRGAHQYPQSVYDALNSNEHELLVQLQEADLDTLDTDERELFIELHSRLSEAIVEAERADEAPAPPPAAPVEEEKEEEPEEPETPASTVKIKRDSPYYGEADPDLLLEATLDEQRERWADITRMTADRDAAAEGSKKRARLTDELNAAKKVYEDYWIGDADTFDGVDLDAKRAEIEGKKAATVEQTVAKPKKTKAPGAPPITPPDEAFASRNHNVDTESPEFKQWFSGSKVINDDNTPMAVYHGSPNAGIVEFTHMPDWGLWGNTSEADRKSIEKRKTQQMDAIGTWFGESLKIAKRWTGRMDRTHGSAYAVYLALKNPKRYDSWQALIDDFNASVYGPKGTLAGQTKPAHLPTGLAEGGRDAFRTMLEREGHDGIIVHEQKGIDFSKGIPQTYYVTLQPKQTRIIEEIPYTEADAAETKAEEHAAYREQQRDKAVADAMRKATLDKSLPEPPPGLYDTLKALANPDGRHPDDALTERRLNTVRDRGWVRGKKLTAEGNRQLKTWDALEEEYGSLLHAVQTRYVEDALEALDKAEKKVEAPAAPAAAAPEQKPKKKQGPPTTLHDITPVPTEKPSLTFRGAGLTPAQRMERQRDYIRYQIAHEDGPFFDSQLKTVKIDPAKVEAAGWHLESPEGFAPIWVRNGKKFLVDGGIVDAVPAPAPEKPKGQGPPTAATGPATPFTEEQLIALGDAQRDAPEHAMLKAQTALGGGVMQVAIEHVGDLTHRMADRNTVSSAGYEFVKEKVEKMVRSLSHKYGFAKEHAENMKGNAEYHKVDLDTYLARVATTLKEYAKAHAALTVYNDAQRIARAAAVALGDQRFDVALTLLGKLQKHLGSEAEWKAYAHDGLTAEGKKPALTFGEKPKASVEADKDQPVLPGDVGEVRGAEVASPPVAELPQQGLVLKGQDVPEHMRPKEPSLFDKRDEANKEITDAINDLFKGFGGISSNPMADVKRVNLLTMKVFRVVQAIAKKGIIEAQIAWDTYIVPAFGEASGDLILAFRAAWKTVYGKEPTFTSKHQPSKTPEEAAARMAAAQARFEGAQAAPTAAPAPAAKPEGPPRTVTPPAAPPTKVETKPAPPKTEGPPRATKPAVTETKPAAPAPPVAPDMTAYNNLKPYQKAWVDASVAAQKAGMGTPSFTRFNIPYTDHAMLYQILAAQLQAANTPAGPKAAKPAAPAGPTEPTHVTDEQKAILDEYGLKVVGNDMRGSVPVVKIQGKTDKDTYDRKEIFRAVDGRFRDIPFKHWQVPLGRLADLIRALSLVPKTTGRPAGRIPAHIRDASLAQLRTSAAARPDRSGFADGIQGYISPRTQGVIQRGADVGIRQETLDEQKQDVAILVRNQERGNKAGILASDPGTGKTYVLGGMITELIHRGMDTIIYVTKNNGLVDQAKKDMAGFGIVDRVQFMTYAKFRETPPPENGVDLLIFDEAHEIKNLKVGQESSQALQAQQWIANAKYTVMATATPYENPTQLQYLAPTGIFDDVFGAFHKFASAFGATPILVNKEAVKAGADPVYRYEWKRTISSNDDQKQAREWMRKEGFFTSRKMRLPKEQTETHLVKVTGDPDTALLFKALMDAREDNPPPGYGSAWVTNFAKRLLESSKIEIAIEQAQKALDRDRYPIIFIETKAENIIDIKYQLKEERRWEEAAAIAKRAGMDPPDRKTAGFGGKDGLLPLGIAAIMKQVMERTGKEIIHIKPAEQMIQDAFGADNVAIYTGSIDDAPAQKNLAAWRTQGKPRVLVATMAKGGTGLSLHDKVGNHQTTQINVNLPWTPTGVVQVTQRSMRYGMQGTAESMWLFASNISLDRHLSKIVGRRLQDMGSLVHGEVADDAVDLDNYNFQELVQMEAEKERRARGAAATGLMSWRNFTEATAKQKPKRETHVYKKDTGEEDVPLPYDEGEDRETPEPDEEGEEPEPEPEGEDLEDQPPPPEPKTFYDVEPKGPATHPITGEPVHPLGLTEIVAMGKDWWGLPKVVEKFRKLGTLGQLKTAGDKAGVKIKASLFEKGNYRELMQVLAHELGHLIDWLPDYVLKRGNLLGHLFTLRKFMDSTFIGPDGRIVFEKDIHPELIKVTELWSPYNKEKASDKYRKYRESSVELMAEAMSALLTDPQFLQKNAPNFFREFFHALDRKPEVKAAFEAMQALMRLTPEQRAEERVKRDIETKEEIDKRAIQHQKDLKEAAKAAKWDNWWLRLKTDFLDKHAPVIKKVKEVMAKTGAAMAEHLDPRYLLQERNYVGGKIKGWLSQNVYPLVLELDEAGINWHTFGLALEYDRTIKGDYEGKLSPNGLTPDTAQDNRDALLKTLTDQQRELLEDGIDRFREAVKEIVEEAYQAGLYTPEAYKQFKKNPAYATFRGIDFIEESVSARVIHAVGSAQELQNVGTATILKMIVTMRETQNQKVKRSVFDMLEEHFEDDIERVKRVGPKEFAAPKNKKLKEVGYFDNGVWQKMYVDPMIADSLNNESIGHNNMVVQAISYMNSKVFRPLFVGYNPGFMTFNVVRDFLRTWKNYNDKGHQLSLAGAIKRYRQAHAIAKIRGFGAPKNMTPQQEKAWSQLTEAEKHFIFGLPHKSNITRHVQETEMKDILARLQVTEEVGPPHTGWRKAVDPIRRIGQWMENVGNYVETLPKAAAMYEMLGDTKNISDLTASQKSYIREKIGTPDVHAGGIYKPITNEVWIFSNVILQGWRADMNVAYRDITSRLPERFGGTNDPTTRSGWAWKTATVNVAPKMIMMAATAGLLGEWLRKLFAGVSEYDKSNYLVIPFDLDANGNTVYMRLPQDDTGRFIGGLAWKAMRQDKNLGEVLAGIVDYTGGQIPAVTPSYGAIKNTYAMASGQNPYDAFRSRNLFTDQEMAAGGARNWRRFLGWEFNQLGGSTYFGNFFSEKRPEEKTVGQKILDFPTIPHNVLGRWIRISDYGVTESNRAAMQEVVGARARLSRDEKDEVTDAIMQLKTRPPWEQQRGSQIALARKIVQEVYPDMPRRDQREKTMQVQKKIAQGMVRGSADPWVDSILVAGSNAEKRVVIEKARKGMTKEEFDGWLSRAASNQIISRELAAQIRTGRPTR